MFSYRDAGKGEAVVLLHGFPLDHTIWGAQSAALSGRYRVILPDLPGMGGSTPLSPSTMNGMARTVLDLLDRLGVERAAVAGHSMGGYVALALQKDAPDRVAGLGLICTQAGADSPEGREGRFATAKKVEAEGPELLVGGMGPKFFAPDTAPESEPYRTAVALIRNSSIAGIQACLYAMADREDHRGRLGELRAPALVLTGAQDLLIPPARSEEMAAVLPDARLVKVPGAGHLPMLEQPEAVSRALSDWLGRVYPA
jgi:3-oxoadipate enol-lactonase